MNHENLWAPWRTVYLRELKRRAEQLGDAELEALGLRPARVVIRVLGRVLGAAGADAAAEGEGTGKVLAELALGETDETRGILALRGSRPPVFVLDYELGEQIPTSWEAYQAIFVTPAVEAAGDSDEEEADGGGEDSGGEQGLLEDEESEGL